MARVDDLNWARQRALEYVDMGRQHEAISSMISDLNKFDLLEGGTYYYGLLAPLGGSAEEVRQWIEGFQ